MTPATVIWLQLTGILALEITLLAFLGLLLERFIQSAGWRRTLWQACLIAAITVLALELCGFARAFLPPAKRPATFHRHVTTATTQFSDPAKLASYHHLSDDFRALATERSHPRPPQGPGMIPTSMIVPPPSAPNTEQSARVGTEKIVADVMVLLVWTVGFVAVLGRALLRRAVFVMLQSKWTVVANCHLEGRVQALAPRLEMRRRIRLFESPKLACPVAFGFFRPSIGLPAAFAEEFEQSEQDAVLLHELAHLRSHDPLWRLAADVVTALLWWHPLMWWMRRRLEAVCETAADEASQLLSNGPSLLAKCLVRLGTQLAQTKSDPTPAIAITGFRSNLGRRVERLVHLNGRSWHAPCPRRSVLARLAGIVSLTLATILCTAWTVPAGLNKGENMQTMQHTWKRSLAAFGLLAALGTQNQAAIAQKSDELVSGAQLAATRQGQNTTTGALNSSAANQLAATASDTVVTSSARFPSDPKSSSKEKQAVETKLRQMIVDQVGYNGVTLSEVVHDLGEMAAHHDPGHVGINFLVESDRQVAPANVPGAVDPTTGLPLAAPAPEILDLNNVAVHLEPPLKHVRLIDVLDAITKVTEHPIKYSIEDYGVVFASDESAVPQRNLLLPASEPLGAWTYKVDTNTFFAGLESAFGIRLPESSKRRPQDIQGALRSLLVQLGISDPQNKSIFYNPLTGVLMVRGTGEDRTTVGAAIQTLGGAEYSPSSAQNATSPYNLGRP